MRIEVKLVIPNTGISGTCFDRAAIPFPEGALADTGWLRLLENGVPVPAQFGVLLRWADESVRWASVDFAIRFDDGVPRAYYVDDGASRGLTVEESADRILIDTGRARFEVSRRYAGPVAPDESHGGPYITDASGNVYRPGHEATTEVLSSGPFCAELVSRGWYENEKHGVWHQYVVRIRAFYGATHLDVEHQTVLTQDTRGRPIADVGYSLPVKVPAYWYAGVDGSTREGAGKRVYAHQYRHDQVRVVPNEDEFSSFVGKKSDGWLAVRQNDYRIASVVLKDAWQRFPKELEFSIGKLVVHAWPKHGIQTFSKEEELHPDNVWRLLYAHHGQVLDLSFPADLAEKLLEMNASKKWDHEGGTIDRALRATCAGASITSRFAFDVRPYGKDTDVGAEIGAFARCYLEEPHAVASPEWLEITGAARFWDDVAPRGPLTEHADEFLHGAFPKWLLDWREFAREYGMWVFANGHDTTDTKRTPQMSDDKPQLHRLFQNSHYSQVGLLHALHLRSPDAQMLRLARDFTRTWLDVGSTPDGQSRHCKSFVPWDNSRSLSAHFADADTALVASVVDRDSRAADFHAAWRRNMARKRGGPVVGRESVNELAHVLSACDATRDPWALEYAREAVELFVGRPWQDWGKILPPSGTTFVMWHVRWLDRAFAVTGDARLIDRAREFVEANPDHAGLSGAMFLYDATGDARYLTDALPRFMEWLELPKDVTVYWRHFRDAMNFAAKLRRAGI